MPLGGAVWQPPAGCIDRRILCPPTWPAIPHQTIPGKKPQIANPKAASQQVGKSAEKLDYAMFVHFSPTNHWSINSKIESLY